MGIHSCINEITLGVSMGVLVELELEYLGQGLEVSEVC